MTTSVSGEGGKICSLIISAFTKPELYFQPAINIMLEKQIFIYKKLNLNYHLQEYPMCTII